MVVERPGLERRLLEVLEAGRIPVVLGGCASGRTSLLFRLEHLLGGDAAQYLDFGAVATTPERCFHAVTAASRLKPGPGAVPPAPSTPRAAFDGLMAFFDRAAAPRQRQAVFLLDDVFDIRTFENFPGLRQVQHDLISRLSSSPAGFVLASRFTARSHRLLRDAPARFEVVHIPPLSVPDVELLARRFDAGRPSRTPRRSPHSQAARRATRTSCSKPYRGSRRRQIRWRHWPPCSRPTAA